MRVSARMQGRKWKRESFRASTLLCKMWSTWSLACEQSCPWRCPGRLPLLAAAGATTSYAFALLLTLLLPGRLVQLLSQPVVPRRKQPTKRFGILVQQDLADPMPDILKTWVLRPLPAPRKPIAFLQCLHWLMGPPFFLHPHAAALGWTRTSSSACCASRGSSGKRGTSG